MQTVGKWAKESRDKLVVLDDLQDRVRNTLRKLRRPVDKGPLFAKQEVEDELRMALDDETEYATCSLCHRQFLKE